MASEIDPGGAVAASGEPGSDVDGAGGEDKEMSFETALATLEEIVTKLEAGNLSLDDSLAMFERGVGLARLCARRLGEAERKIELLVEKSGDVMLVEAPDLDADEGMERADGA